MSEPGDLTYGEWAFYQERINALARRVGSMQVILEELVQHFSESDDYQLRRLAAHAKELITKAEVP